jgi:hypothetical protein
MSSLTEDLHFDLLLYFSLDLALIMLVFFSHACLEEMFAGF